MIHLTQREWSMLTFIARYLREHGYAPSMREIAASLGLEMGGGITYTLQCLEKKGAIHQLPMGRKRVRAISLVRGVQVAVTP